VLHTALEHGADAIQGLADRMRLGQESLRSGAGGRLHDVTGIVGGDHHARDRGMPRADVAERPQPVLVAEPQVDQHQIDGGVLVEEPERLPAGRRPKHQRAQRMAAERAHHALAIQRIAVDDQDLPHRHGPPAGSRIAGLLSFGTCPSGQLPAAAAVGYSNSIRGP